MEDDNDHIRVPFSLDAPYLTTGQMEDVPTQGIYLEDHDYDECYLAPQVSEPTDAAIASLIRSELATLFHEKTAEMIRYDRTRFTDKWSSLMGMSAFDDTLPTLSDLFFRARGKVEEYSNKHIAIYFQCTNGDKTHQPFKNATGGMVGRYVYRHWLQMHRGRPPFQRRHFLAKPIEFARGHEAHDLLHYERHYLVTDLPYVLEFHRSLCDSLAAREDDIRHGDVNGPRAKVGYLTGNKPKYPRWECPDFAPCPSEEPLSYRQHGYQLGHLFRSLFLVVDDGHYHSDESPDDPEEDEEWLCADYRIKPALERGAFQLGKFDQDEKYRDWKISRCPVLLVRTGDEGHLSAPISFQPLFDSQRALPIDREDCGSWEDAVRVRLDHALEFIEELIGREKEALPHIYEAAEALDTELDKLCEQWIERVPEHAAEIDFDNNGFTWKAIRRARARLNGEAFDIYQISPDWKWLRSWFEGGTQ